MRGDEGQLIPAGKEPQKNERIAWVFEGFDQHGADALLQFGPTGHPLCLHHRQEDQRADDNGCESDENMLPGHDAQQVLCQWGADHLTDRARGGGDGQRHGSMLIRGRPTHYGLNHTKASPGDTETNQYPIGLHRVGGDRIGR